MRIVRWISLFHRREFTVVPLMLSSEEKRNGVCDLFSGWVAILWHVRRPGKPWKKELTVMARFDCHLDDDRALSLTNFQLFSNSTPVMAIIKWDFFFLKK